MRSFKLFLILAIIVFINSCGEKKPKPLRIVSSYEIIGRDTINFTDHNGFKQGHWLVRHYFKSDGPVPVESGDYVNNMKQGIWNYYDSTGKIIRTVRYKNDMPQPR